MCNYVYDKENIFNDADGMVLFRVLWLKIYQEDAAGFYERWACEVASQSAMVRWKP